MDESLTTVGKMDRSETLLREAVELLRQVHDEMYAFDTAPMDVVADEFDMAQGEIEFALRQLPTSIQKAKRLLR